MNTILDTRNSDSSKEAVNEARESGPPELHLILTAELTDSYKGRSRLFLGQAVIKIG